MIQQSKNYKIAIVAYNLNIGGLAKVIINLFVLFNKVKTIEANLLLLDDSIEYEVYGNVVNFRVYTKKGNTFSEKMKKYIQFKKYLKKEQFDFIIDLRYRLNPISEILITKFLYPKTNIIYTVHSSKIESYLLKNTTLTNWLYGMSYKVICVALANEKKVILEHHLENTTVIYNPIDFEEINKKCIEEVTLDFEYVLAVGRLVELKQFDKLIITYLNSELPNNGIKLVIVGDGPELVHLMKIKKEFDLENHINFIGFSDNPYKYMKNALFFILCSQYEGFPLVVLETLATSTPVVSFDLVSGPNEVIEHQKNGLLVENQNFEKLKEAMNLMYLDKLLYNNCKSNTYASVQKFSFGEITKEWLDLLKIEFDEH